MRGRSVHIFPAQWTRARWSPRHHGSRTAGVGPEEWGTSRRCAASGRGTGRVSWTGTSTSPPSPASSPSRTWTCGTSCRSPAWRAVAGRPKVKKRSNSPCEPSECYCRLSRWTPPVSGVGEARHVRHPRHLHDPHLQGELRGLRLPLPLQQGHKHTPEILIYIRWLLVNLFFSAGRTNIQWEILLWFFSEQFWLWSIQTTCRYKWKC